MAYTLIDTQPVAAAASKGSASLDPMRGMFSHLPIIDISGMYSHDLEVRKKAAEELGRAARQSGFFYISGHRISKALREDLISRAKLFFALPTSEKMRYYIGNAPAHRGYVPEGEEVFAAGKKDKKEAFDTGLDLPSDDEAVLTGAPMHGSNVWPEVDGFRDGIANYYAAAMELGRTLFRAFSLALDLPENHFDQYLTKPPSQLRLIHYPHDPDAVDAQGIGAHTDYECFTILLPTAPGLEVMNRNGEWIDAPPVEDAFIVNIGDMLEIWTGGTFIATSHRVRKVTEERYSFPLFFACDYHTRVAPLPAFASEEALRKYSPVHAGDHLLAQTAQSFTYLKERIAKGELVLPDGSKALSSYGQEALQASRGQ
ncbi:MAG: isopenicillin N synthase family dioxygenase [Burkholderiaceae bacterium]